MPPEKSRRWLQRLSPRHLIAVIRHLPQTLRLIVRLFGDSRVPRRLKVYCVLALIYFVSPLDLIPDWVVPVLGEIDDLTVLIWAFNKLVRDAPEGVVREHRSAIEAGRSGTP